MNNQAVIKFIRLSARLNAYPDGFLRKDSYPFVVFIESVEVPVKILCVTLQISINFDLYSIPAQFHDLRIYSTNRSIIRVYGA